jgi:hypothetical protein
MEDRGYYEAALRADIGDDDISAEFLIADEATAEAVEGLQEEIRQLQLALQMVQRKAEIQAKKLTKLELRFEELEARRDDGK